jgi:hypothetical protein
LQLELLLDVNQFVYELRSSVLSYVRLVLHVDRVWECQVLIALHILLNCTKVLGCVSQVGVCNDLGHRKDTTAVSQAFRQFFGHRGFGFALEHL